MKKLNASGLTSHIGFWMRLVSNQVSQSFARSLEDVGVTVAEWVVLREMYGTDEVTSPGAIADLTGLTRGAISKLVSRLLEKNLVSRKEAAGDRRYQDIQLTQKAKNIIPKLAALADKNDDSFFSVLSKTDKKALTEILIRLARHHQITKMPVE